MVGISCAVEGVHVPIGVSRAYRPNCGTPVPMVLVPLCLDSCAHMYVSTPSPRRRWKAIRNDSTTRRTAPGAPLNRRIDHPTELPIILKTGLRLVVVARQLQPIAYAPYPTAAPEIGTGSGRLRVSRAAGGRPERGGGPRESRNAGAAAPAPLATARALAIADLPPMQGGPALLFPILSKILRAA